MAGKGRSGAATVMAVAILLSIWFGGYRSLHRLYAEVEMVFTAGAEGDGLGIANDLNERVNLAYDLVTVAKRNLNATDETIVAVLSARDALIGAKTIPDKYKANVKLSEATAALYELLGTKPLSEADARYRKNIYNNLTSRNDTISHDPYNAEALSYNQALNAFPANILKLITFAHKAPLFE